MPSSQPTQTEITQKVALVIEADKSNLDYMADILEISGFSVFKVNHIHQIKTRILKSQPLDLVVINLEPWDQYILSILETIRKKKPLPFTVLTTSKRKNEISPPVRKKADMVVCKPFDYRHLVEEVKRIFED